MKPCTYVLIVADESTSMLGVAQGLREGVNAYLDDLAADTTGRPMNITLATFSEQRRRLCAGADAKTAARLDRSNYRPDGQTALLDAIGTTLTEFDLSTTLGENDKVLFLLATDGAENASRYFSPDQIIELIEAREAGKQWTFIHLAAGREATEQGLSLGLRNVIAIAKADLARRSMYTTMGGATRAWAAGGTAEDVTGAISRELDLAVTGGRQ
jgi:hypothetical protein